MSSFFTAPASQRKRKRVEDSPRKASKRRSIAAPKEDHRNGLKSTSRQYRDESISGSDSDELEGEGNDAEDDLLSSGDENETAAERRLRLAERYLENIREELDPAGYDAADIDKTLIAERLREDVAETKGKIYRHIASELSFSTTSHTQFRADQFGVTALATAPPFVYTVAKDRSIVKWEIPEPPHLDTKTTTTATNVTSRRKPRFLKRYTCRRSRLKDSSYIGHSAEILCIAASASGKFLATGGADRKLIVWDAASLTPLKAFTQHRDSVLSLSFRRNSHTLFSASADRTIKIWSLDEMAYVETLFGHQDQVIGIVGLAQEKCISAGARDRTARLWKVVEESQLVFRGSGVGSTRSTKTDDASYAEGSIDCVALVDEDTFVTGSDNGSINLWSTLRKKPIFTVSLAHGLDTPLRPDEASAEHDPEPIVPGRLQPRWITALATVPYSDLILSGSWDGFVRAWKISQDKRRIEEVGVVASHLVESNHVSSGVLDAQNGTTELLHGDTPQESGSVNGVINDLAVFERGERGKAGLCVVAAISKEHRLGKWRKVRKARCGLVLFEVSPKDINGAGELPDVSQAPRI